MAEEKKIKRVQLNISESLYNRVRTACGKKEIDVTAYIRLAIQDALNRDEREEKEGKE